MQTTNVIENINKEFNGQRKHTEIAVGERARFTLLAFVNKTGIKLVEKDALFDKWSLDNFPFHVKLNTTNDII